MEIELSQKCMDAIAYKVAKILKCELKKESDLPELVSTAEAAKILNISQDRLRHIGHRFPRIKGEGRNGRLLYIRSKLMENY